MANLRLDRVSKCFGWVLATLNPFWHERVRLRTALSADACRQTLAAGVVNLNLWSLFGPRNGVALGSVSATGFRIRKLIRYRNSFQTLAVGRFIPSSAGTTIEVSLAVGGYPWGGVAWTLLTIVLPLVGLGLILFPNPSSVSRWAFLWPAVLVMPTAMRLLGRWCARGERDFLLRYLQSTWAAEVVPPGTQSEDLRADAG